MKKYKVKLIFRFSDTVEVEANNKEEAEEMALEICDPQEESHVDTLIKEILP